AFKVSHSNGVTEGLNNKIKLIKRIAFGYRNFYNFRARIYLQQGLIFEN
ncbi:TPA: transposase, partial [Enterococcus faecium]